MVGRTIQEQTEVNTSALLCLRIGLSPQTRHKLKKPRADFGGFLRVSAGGKFVASYVDFSKYENQMPSKLLIFKWQGQKGSNPRPTVLEAGKSHLISMA
jgi:hypothetical protein